MKKMALGLITIGILSTSLFAKKVITCSAYFASAKAELSCSGDYNGKTTMVELYKKGWRFAGDIAGANKFILVFEK